MKLHPAGKKRIFYDYYDSEIIVNGLRSEPVIKEHKKRLFSNVESVLTLHWPDEKGSPEIIIKAKIPESLFSLKRSVENGRIIYRRAML